MEIPSVLVLPGLVLAINANEIVTTVQLTRDTARAIAQQLAFQLDEYGGLSLMFTKSRFCRRLGARKRREGALLPFPISGTDHPLWLERPSHSADHQSRAA